MMRTGLSGAAATALDVAVMVVLVELLRTRVGWAAFCAASCGAVANFTINKYWAFRDRSPIDPRQVIAYGAVALGAAGLAAVSVHLLVEVGGHGYLWAKGLAAVGVFALWSYPAQSRLVFPAARLPQLDAPLLLPEAAGEPDVLIITERAA
jgi:putative flippase GtrA